jgi:hypothetical protein
MGLSRDDYGQLDRGSTVRALGNLPRRQEEPLFSCVPMDKPGG